MSYTVTEYFTVHIVQYLRQLLDSQGVYNLANHNCWSNIEGLTLFGAMTSSDDERPSLPPCLQRHFVAISLPELEGCCLELVTSEMLRILCGGGEEELKLWDSSQETFGCIVKSSVDVYHHIREVFRKSNMPGRQHYLFSLGHLENTFQVSLSLSLSLPLCGGGREERR